MNRYMTSLCGGPVAAGHDEAGGPVEGMSLLDHFATHAMAAMLSSGGSPMSASRIAYEVAREMLAERACAHVVLLRAHKAAEEEYEGDEA